MAGTIIADTWQNGDGSQNYKCRAWVNFNGTGTVAIRASGNVSSITDNAVGLFTVNFINAMPDSNYAVCGVAKDTDSSYGSLVSMGLPGPGSPVTLFSNNSVSVSFGYGGTTYDCEIHTVNIFR